MSENFQKICLGISCVLIVLLIGMFFKHGYDIRLIQEELTQLKNIKNEIKSDNNFVDDTISDSKIGDNTLDVNVEKLEDPVKIEDSELIVPDEKISEPIKVGNDTLEVKHEPLESLEEIIKKSKEEAE